MTNSTSRTLQPMLISWRFVRLAFGVFLLVTAFLKWRGFGTPNVLFDIAPSLEFGLIQLEVLLALWLMSGWKTVAAWFCTVGLFATFAGASLAMVMQKRSSCGCFGAVDVNPTWALAIDVFAIGLLLLVGRMEANRVVEPTSEWLGFKPNRQKWSLSIAIAFIASAIGFAGIVFNTEIGSLYARNMPIALSGQVLVTEPLVVAAGPGIEGEWVSILEIVR